MTLGVRQGNWRVVEASQVNEPGMSRDVRTIATELFREALRDGAAESANLEEARPDELQVWAGEYAEVLEERLAAAGFTLSGRVEGTEVTQ